MTVHIWRIAVDSALYASTDLTGEGARLTGGRWNSPGAPVVYASTTIALACLETLVHLNASSLPLHRYLVRIDVPDQTWKVRATRTPTSLPSGWDAIPYGRVSINVGNQWIQDRSTLLLEVPSAIVPEEANVLINPAHADSARLKATKVRKWTYVPRALATH